MVRAPLALVVEDDPAVARLERDVLADAGYRVAGASDGYDALAECAIADPDVILLDVRLPRMDGIEFLNRYRARSDARAKIVIVTALVNGALEGVVVDDLVGKPFDTDDLLRRVKQLAPLPLGTSANRFEHAPRGEPPTRS